ncbi:uncharacterized protein LOC115631615 [Scaptodrosophila lebanonensis]|uniref:Cytidine deaminase n=1 Tax=Drosophila lebanonensis TaxID=7225 RepID=A0A6J2U8G5_DROLE|nr:uncharacterized protein LOC115631615 [Scaptodrosophila lebanonensis]
MAHLIKRFATPSKPELVVTYGSLDADVQELLLSAFTVRLRAYAPYSNFKVGATFRGKARGEIFSGCNVENSCFSPSSCAERTALTKAISEGEREFLAGAVVAYQPDVFTTPCGVCRQFIREFTSDNDMPIYVAQAREGRTAETPFANEDPVLCTSIFNLLPNSFHTYQI